MKKLKVSEEFDDSGPSEEVRIKKLKKKKRDHSDSEHPGINDVVNGDNNITKKKKRKQTEPINGDSNDLYTEKYKSNKDSVNSKISSKKRNENNKDSDDEYVQEQEDEISDSERKVDEILSQQEFPIKSIPKQSKKIKKNETVEQEDEKDEKSEEKKIAAIAYLRLWRKKRAEWKFKKVRQTWLLQHIYDEDNISAKHFKTLLKYLEDLKGKSRDLTVKQAHTIIEENEDTEEIKRSRAMDVLRILS